MLCIRMVSLVFRKPARLGALGFFLFVLTSSISNCCAQVFTVIGLTQLRAVTTNLDGSGVRVMQVEAQQSFPPIGDWEVAPGNNQINLPVADFTWFTTNASATNFPNGLGIDSGHADQVGGYFYGLPGGVSTNVGHIDNVEADNFYDMQVPMLQNPDTSVRIVNQSFADPELSDQVMADKFYDDYAAQFNVLFITGVGDGQAANATHVLPPSTCYNGIGVSAYYNTNATGIGPTADNGRAKPDITAPQSPTSFSTPLVSGAAAILMQAGMQGDGGSDTNSATDSRTVKALLLNGAIKPAIWSNPSPSPLDPLFGAGILDVLESYVQLTGGKHGYIATSMVTTNTAHPPTGATGNVSSLVGWDFNTISSSSPKDTINHYCFSVNNGAGGSPFSATITLVWNRQLNQSAINNLDLFLYDMTNGNLVASSTSLVDNVEHIFLPQLPAARYDLEVLKHGGAMVSPSETYALAFEFFAARLNVKPVAGGVLVSWPVYPDAFQLQSCNGPNSPWSFVGATPGITNGQNCVFAGTGIPAQYFRLCRWRDP
jgi:Subtilase family